MSGALRNVGARQVPFGEARSVFRFPRWLVRAHIRARFSVVIAAAFALSFQCLPVSSAVAQESEQGLRRFTITAGLGNPMGWLGTQGEAYFAREYLSAFLGLGYTPEFDSNEPRGPTFAAGLRAYTAGARHRGYAELSVSQIMTVSDGEDYVNDEWVAEPGQRLYGPGLQLGYQYASFGGFTIQTSLGIGYAPTADEADLGFYPFESWAPMAALGIGYTWR
jgi:hypothetical protein